MAPEHQSVSDQSFEGIVVGQMFDFEHAAMLKDALSRQLDGGDLVLDLRQLESCDLYGLQLLRAAARSLASRDRALVLWTGPVLEAAIERHGWTETFAPLCSTPMVELW